jgi:hypothetical protein
MTLGVSTTNPTLAGWDQKAAPRLGQQVPELVSEMWAAIFEQAQGDPEDGRLPAEPAKETNAASLDTNNGAAQNSAALAAKAAIDRPGVPRLEGQAISRNPEFSPGSQHLPGQAAHETSSLSLMDGVSSLEPSSLAAVDAAGVSCTASQSTGRPSPLLAAMPLPVVFPLRVVSAAPRFSAGVASLSQPLQGAVVATLPGIATGTRRKADVPATTQLPPDESVAIFETSGGIEVVVRDASLSASSAIQSAAQLAYQLTGTSGELAQVRLNGAVVFNRTPSNPERVDPSKPSAVSFDC